jgi:hypothetical protein
MSLRETIQVSVTVDNIELTLATLCWLQGAGRGGEGNQRVPSIVSHFYIGIGILGTRGDGCFMDSTH